MKALGGTTKRNVLHDALRGKTGISFFPVRLTISRTVYDRVDGILVPRRVKEVVWKGVYATGRHDAWAQTGEFWGLPGVTGIQVERAAT